MNAILAYSIDTKATSVLNQQYVLSIVAANTQAGCGSQLMRIANSPAMLTTGAAVHGASLSQNCSDDYLRSLSRYFKQEMFGQPREVILTEGGGATCCIFTCLYARKR